LNYCFYICKVIVNAIIYRMDIAERLIAFKDYTGLTNSQFADKAGIPRPTLSQFLNGRNKRMSDDLAAKLHVAYPELNVMWLLFGEGDMVREQNIEFSEGKIEENSGIEGSQLADLSNDIASDIINEDPAESSAIRKNGSRNMDFTTADAVSAFANHTPIDIPDTPQAGASAAAQIMTTETPKKIQSIMVFYSDNSYEIFTPRETR